MKSSGTYLIAPAAEGNKPLLVHCDISDGMSWITVQRRTNSRVDFNRNWDEYAKGFGDSAGKNEYTYFEYSCLLNLISCVLTVSVNSVTKNRFFGNFKYFFLFDERIFFLNNNTYFNYRFG